MNSITFRLRLLISVLFLVVAVILLKGILSYWQTTSELKQLGRGAVASVSETIQQLVSLQDENTRKNVRAELAVFNDYIDTFGGFSIDTRNTERLRIVNQATGNTETVDVPIMRLGEHALENNFELVDYFQDKYGGTATIFQVLPDKLLRLSTNVLKENGSRAVGTYISPDSPVYKTVMSGSIFIGKAFVVNDYYLTGYAPVKDSQGNVIAVIYVGRKMLDEALVNALSKIKVNGKGYVFAYNAQGNFVVHPNADLLHQDIDNLEFGKIFRETGNGLAEYEILGDKKVSYLQEFSPWELTFGFGLTHAEMLAGADQRAAKKNLISSIIALVLGIAVAMFVIRSVIKQLGGQPETLVDIANKLTSGDLSMRISLQKNDSASLAAAMSQMVEKMRQVVEGVREDAEAVATASQQVNASAQSLSQGATEQASGMEQTSESMNKLHSSVKDNADHALETQKVALDASSEAKEGGMSVGRTVNSMQKIADQIELIEGIAYKTNLLSLNATIEAARAGYHGKSFAVVASEIRKLAEHSQITANEMRESTSNSVMVAGEAGQKIETVVPAIGQTADLVENIASGAKMQASEIGHISSTLGELDKVTQQNAAASEELAATADELNGQAKRLLDSTAFFRIQ